MLHYLLKCDDHERVMQDPSGTIQMWQHGL